MSLIAEGLDIFFDESKELMHDIEGCLLSLESSPNDSEVLNRLFRAAHTIKGSSGLFGMVKVGEFTHVVENVLTLMRDGELDTNNKPLISTLFDCHDQILELIANETKNNITSEIEQKSADLVNKLKQYLPVAEQPEPLLSLGDVIINLDEESEPSTESLQVLNPYWLISIHCNPDILTYGLDPMSFLNELKRLGEIKKLTVINTLPDISQLIPSHCYLSFMLIYQCDKPYAMIEEVFEFFEDDCEIKIQPLQDIFMIFLDRLLSESATQKFSQLGRVLVSNEYISGNQLKDALKQQQETNERLGDILINQGLLTLDELDEAIHRQNSIRED
jgi:two-component system, chemotaxis family, sensor kinase CheA